MDYKILDINPDFITGCVIDYYSDDEWVVVTDIPRQMVEYGNVKPVNTSLISKKLQSDDKDDGKEWAEHMAGRFRNWLILEHPEKFYPPIDNSEDNHIEYSIYSRRKKDDIYLSSINFFNFFMSNLSEK